MKPGIAKFREISEKGVKEITRFMHVIWEKCISWPQKDWRRMDYKQPDNEIEQREVKWFEGSRSDWIYSTFQVTFILQVNVFHDC